MTAVDQETCIHHWIIAPATFVQPVSPGECQECHKTGLFQNSVSDVGWKEEQRMSKMREGATTARQARAVKERAAAALRPKRKHVKKED